MSDEYILVTGGAGYIGSHTVIELINNGYKVIIVDNLSNSSYDAVARIEFIVKQSVPFFNVDLRNSEELSPIFEQYKIKGVIHFAALKAVGESTQIPLSYYDNNVGGTISLLNVMKNHNVKTIVFSSSATVYGDVTRFKDNSMIPIPEHCPMDPTNPYGRTKFIIESILKDIYGSEPENWQVAILRYFNPIGAHPSGLLGEDPLGIPNNLLPYLSQVAIGRREKLSVFGNDYESHDGTPIRDYIHVIDLAKGHIAALKYLQKVDEAKEGLYREWNLGTGKGSTVFDVFHSFCKAVGKELPYEVVPRRAGDVLNLTANVSRANKELNWEAELDVDDACRDLWKWTMENPFGFNLENYKWESFEKESLYSNRIHTVTVKDLTVSFINHGAVIQNITYKGKSLVNKYDSGEDYKLDSNPFFGTTVGRYANRISGAKITLDGKVYPLTKNEGSNTLHSGHKGFNGKTFLGPVVKEEKGTFTLEFFYKDENNSDGFPGDLDTVVKYTVDETSVQIEYQAELSSGDSTAVNLTNHSYFNITDNETIDGSIFKLTTDKHLEMVQGIPTGKIVQNSFKSPVELKPESSFDDCFVVTEDTSIDTRSSELRDIVEVSHPSTSIKLTFASTEPAFQLYTGDYTNTKGYGARSGFCVEPSRFVNAINNKEWADQVILKKGELYGSKIKFTIGE